MKNIDIRLAIVNKRLKNYEVAAACGVSEFTFSIVLKEAYTGTTTDRPEWNKLYKKIKTGDSIVFDSVSRMSRNSDEGIELYMDLFNKGVTLVFLKESYIDTSVYRSTIEQTIGSTGNDIADIYIEATNKVIKLLAEKQIRKAFEQAEKEVEDLHQRTREGIETARLEGKQIGRIAGKKYTSNKEKKYKPEILRLSKDFNGTNTDSEVMAFTGLSRGSYYKYKRELKVENENN